MRVCPRCRSVYATPVPWCPLDETPIEERDEDPLIGTRLDRYEVREVLGEGGMGRVYRAGHAVLDREYALKVLFGDYASEPKFAERFRREAQSTSRVRHGNVVAVEDYGQTPEGLTFIALEMVEGETLSEVLAARGPLAPHAAAKIIRELVLGLGAAHAEGLVHRDIKPQNVILTDDGGLKILDFGAVLPDLPNEQRLTSVGSIIGTPSYMAPEQSQDGPIGPAADFYSVGVVLYEMLTGELPFKGKTRAEILVKHIAEPPPDAPASEGLESLVAALLEKRPHARPSSAHSVIELLNALPVCSAEHGVPPTDDMVEGPAATQPIYFPNEITADLEDPDRRATTGSDAEASGSGGVVLTVPRSEDGASDSVDVSSTPEPSSPWSPGPAESAPHDLTRLSDVQPLAGTRTDPSDSAPAGRETGSRRVRRRRRRVALVVALAAALGLAWLFAGDPVRVYEVEPRSTYAP